MKFGKQLRNTVAESLPDWRDHFLDYKGLKKMILGGCDEEEDEASKSNSAHKNQQHPNNCTGHNHGDGDRDGDGHGHGNHMTLVETVKVMDHSQPTQMLRKRNRVRLPNLYETGTEQGVQIHAEDISDSDEGEGDYGHGPSKRGRYESNSAAPAASASAEQNATMIANDNNAHAKHCKDPNHPTSNIPNEHFLNVLKKEVTKVNDFFLDKEEDFIIRYEFLTSEVSQALMEKRLDRTASLSLKRKLVDMHGELVLLENFAHVNYIGFRKILKKHDKKTGMNIQHTYLNAVLVTPFFQSKTLPKLLDGTEAQLRAMDMNRENWEEIDESFRTKRDADVVVKSDWQSRVKSNAIREGMHVVDQLHNLASSWLHAVDDSKRASLKQKILRVADSITGRDLGLSAFDACASDDAISQIHLSWDKEVSVSLLFLPPRSCYNTLSLTHQFIAGRVLHGSAFMDMYQCVVNPGETSAVSSFQVYQPNRCAHQRIVARWPSLWVDGAQRSILSLTAENPVVMLLVQAADSIQENVVPFGVTKLDHRSDHNQDDTNVYKLNLSAAGNPLRIIFHYR
eukprot:CAMPEP_0184694460 /NCGR_PEP_ID=MMETSP0313-20130426/2413_1 /TAXON_ID=2792 /ORGANISM="Porphyridium aerugineum, Strain SAG 1380-2" /LENGTH=566 /DNA_ID=CAMNT_0027152755 /DNA_START=327 /DNA_END=2027 /DNA_ORIENTATION=-